MTAGFFGKLFGGGTETVKIEMQVYMHRNYVNQLIVDAVKAGSAVIVSFFESTHHQLQQMAGDAYADKFFLYSALHQSSALTKIQLLAGNGHRVVLSERFPIPTREAELISHLHQWGIASKVSSYCALDDLIMQAFGSDKIMNLMQRMGMNETDCIQHEMINASLVRAQNKVAKKVTYEQQAKSPEEWFRLNAPLAK